jgi:hypothetical protein
MSARISPLLLSIAFCLTGCFPYHYTLRPGVSGVVIDDRNATPIPGAIVVVSSHGPSQKAEDLTLTTGPDGTFYLAPRRRWGVYIMPMDAFGPWTEATISAPGFETRSFRLSASDMGPKEVSLGNVRLEQDK